MGKVLSGKLPYPPVVKHGNGKSHIYVYIYDFPIIDIHWVQGFPISTFDYWARNQIVHYSSRFPHYSWLYAATCSRWIAGKSWISRCYRSYLTWPCQIPRHKQAPFGDTVYLVSHRGWFFWRITVGSFQVENMENHLKLPTSHWGVLFFHG